MIDMSRGIENLQACCSRCGASRTWRVLPTPTFRAVPCHLVELVRGTCCAREWVGADRAHCCARAGFAGCGQVFDDAELFDAHRDDGRCHDPRDLGLGQTKNLIWLRRG